MSISLRQIISTAMSKLVGDKNPTSADSGESEIGLKILEGTKKHPPKRGTAEILNAYGTMPWLRAVVHKVSHSLAAVEWKVLVVKEVRTGKAVYLTKMQSSSLRNRKEALQRFKLNKNFSVEELDTHPILDFLGQGNTFFPGNVSFQLTSQYLDLVGESLWIMERNGLGSPFSYFPIPPSWIHDIATPTNPYFTIKTDGGEEFKIPTSEVIWFYEPNPSNPYGRGSGSARALADELDTDEYAAKFTKNKFFNQARPDILVAAPGLQKDETDRLEQGWNQKLQGIKNVAKTFFINREIEVHELSPSFVDLQLIELRKYERDTVFQVYGVPPELFGVLTSSNRATIESAEFLYSKHVLVPRLEFMRAVLQWRLVREFDERLILDFESPVEEDFDKNLSAATVAPHSLTINEWREMAGRVELPDEDGNRFMVPFNLMPISTFEEYQESAIDLGSDNEEDTPAEEEDEKQSGDTIAWEDFEIKAIDPDLLEDLDGDVLRSITILDNGSVRTSTWKVIERKLAEIVRKFGAAAIAEAGVNISFEDTKRVVDWIAENGLKRSKLYDATTQTQLARVLSKGVKNGESIDQLARRVEKLYGEIVGGRAFTIANTETVRAANFGAVEGASQAGIEEKEWLSTRDNYVRDSHASLDGKIVSVDKNFKVTRGEHSGAETLYPGGFGVAALDINCRCTVLPVFAGQSRSSANSEEKRVTAWKLFESNRKPHERELRREIRKSLLKQKDIVIRTLRGN